MELADKPIELRKAEGAYRRLRERFEAAARLFVLVGSVELIAGEPLPLEETFAARRAFVSHRRERQAERRQRTAAEQAERAELRNEAGERNESSADDERAETGKLM
jgi:hypothetical protein